MFTAFDLHRKLRGGRMLMRGFHLILVGMVDGWIWLHDSLPSQLIFNFRSRIKVFKLRTGAG